MARANGPVKSSHSDPRRPQVISDAQLGAAAMGNSPVLFPKMTVPRPEMTMGISALDERVRQGTLRGRLPTVMNGGFAEHASKE